MTRAVPEWIGKTDDTPPPARVKRRILERHGWLCYLTKIDLRAVKASDIQFDHIKAIINGGENRESNLAPAWKPAHAAKTRKDVAEKSRIAGKVKHHYALENKSGRRLPGCRTNDYKLAIGGGTKPRHAPVVKAPVARAKPLYEEVG